VRNELVLQESFLLRNINSINTLLTATEKKKKVDDVLNQMISPQHWKSSNGDEIEVQMIHLICCDSMSLIYFVAPYITQTLMFNGASAFNQVLLLCQ
jgi:hypothetical protein